MKTIRRLMMLFLLSSLWRYAGASQTIVSLTFDDGYDDAPLAAQLLEQHGFRGTFYIISGVLGQSPYMSVAQVQALQAAGHEIGGHTVSHKNLTTLTTDQARH